MNDRLSHDPHLSASLREMLTAGTPIRSTTGVLAETEDIAPEWRAKFHANLQEDSERLAAGAEALVAFLDGTATGLGRNRIAVPPRRRRNWRNGRRRAIGRSWRWRGRPLPNRIFRKVLAARC